MGTKFDLRLSCGCVPYFIYSGCPYGEAATGVLVRRLRGEGRSPIFREGVRLGDAKAKLLHGMITRRGRKVRVAKELPRLVVPPGAARKKREKGVQKAK